MQKTKENHTVAKPHLCPVCQGRGTVPVGFYSPGTLSSSLTPETCRTCQGFGVVWDYTDNGPGWGWIVPVTCQDINKTTTIPPKGTVVNDDLGAKP